MQKTKKILFLDPFEEVIKIVDVSSLDEFDLVYSGQLLLRDSELTSFDVVICINTINLVNQYLMLEQMLAGKLTIVIKDGLYDWTNAYYNPKHLQRGLALYDPIPARVILGLNDGSQEFLEYQNPGIKYFSYIPNRMEKSLTSRVKRKGVSSSVLLITTANAPYFNNDEKRELVKLINSVISQAENVFDVVVLRIFDEDLMAQINGEGLRNDTSSNFNDLMSKVDFLVTTPSSVSIEAMAYGVPVAHFDYRSSPILYQSAWRITASVSIRDTLLSMLNHEPERMEFQNFVIRKIQKDPKTLKEILNSRIEPMATGYTGYYSSLREQAASRVLNSRWNFNLYLFMKKIIRIVGTFK
ncbi:hypothetical protein ACMZOO_13125 [Catenovulum sp. SX2]|uniref:hypothetical protein n=1 Tax=Catenovulum sp. SX2 TaxID=3398614 RepID=UPI003F84AC46